ncbi:hemerythrin domain-containing protein [Pseudaquabacterium pictum]|uniref:Hemerythrin-like domain-containing protein n=1 Tax=Pseudaquabacterium pictum TaxID=2315236 RepID=A0A480AKK0_9BURK|nr:hemerythrin domain-containing protein [Rubrivivax pictus]GCL62134.1 hypothetical protein AQPW35_12150 [Rubrivivax pictus]
MTTDTLFATETRTPASPAARAAAPAAAVAQRLDFYAPIHKALRSCMLDTLLRCGRLDVQDSAEMQATLGRLDGLLRFCSRHLQHENDFVHPALEARRTGASWRIAGEHVEHQHHIAALGDLAAQLRAAGADSRPALALRLYRQLALFVADNFQHMHVEETAHNQALWATHTDGELTALHDRLLASIPPADMLDDLRWMVPALTPQERAGLLNEIRQTMPPEPFANLVDQLRPHLDHAAWAKLAPAIGLPQQPGLVCFA